MDRTIRSILAENARLLVSADAIGDHDDLYQAGMTSHATVNVMVALEEAFDVEFPEEMLRRSTFESIAAMRAALDTLVEPG